MTQPLPIRKPVERRSSAGLARVAAVILLLSLFGLYDAFFTVIEGEAVVVTRFGRPVREIVNAGPYWKFPSPIEQKHVVDRRRFLFNAPESAGFTADKRSIVVSCFVVWHVERPLLWLQTVGDRATTESRLTSMLLAAENQRLGQYSLSALVSVRPEDIRMNELERQIHQDLTSVSLESMGISVDQVSIGQLSFPEQNLAAVFERMRVERKAEANRLRAEGSKQAQAIRDKTHVESQEILRKGREDAAKINAEAERRAAQLLAEAQAVNPDFYQFWSSLQASKRVLKEKATLVIGSQQLFFEALNKASDLAKESPADLKTSVIPPPLTPKEAAREN
ncbi:MAG: SPFH domain-containing protein [Planctomycetaceae bacterium]